MFTHKTKKDDSETFSKMSLTLLLSVTIFSAFPANLLYADSVKGNQNDSKLIEDFIKAKNYNNAIVFDSSNIKQFWTNNSVLSKDNSIIIYLKEKTSEPLRIQLANVIETQDCMLQIITEDQDIDFSIMDKDSKVISKSQKEDDFVQYHIHSSVFHLEDTQDFSFKVSFSSENNKSVSIEKIILSFSENKQSRYIGSPGFEELIKKIENEGESVAHTDVKLIINKKYNKIFVKLPGQIANSDNMHTYFHIYPIDKKDLNPDRVQYGFNNMDPLLNSKKVFIPKPYANKSQEEIIQIEFPKYPFSKIVFGQFDREKHVTVWNYTYTNLESMK